MREGAGGRVKCGQSQNSWAGVRSVALILSTRSLVHGKHTEGPTWVNGFEESRGQARRVWELSAFRPTDGNVGCSVCV